MKHAINMTAVTEAKAKAIYAVLKNESNIAEYIAPILAMLTSADKEEREKAKRSVRDLTRAGALVRASEKAAIDLATFANRNEP